jgi:hypothetical protein
MSARSLQCRVVAARNEGNLMSGRGIRRYEPGGFYGVIDKCAYDVALEMGVDRDVDFTGVSRTAGSVADGAAWCGLLWLKRPWIRKQTVGEHIADITIAEYGALTRQEEASLASVAILFLERSNGHGRRDPGRWIDTVWYDDPTKAEEDWDDIEKELRG